MSIGSRSLAAAIFAAALLAGCGDRPEAAIGQPPPVLAALDLAGQPVHLGDFAGRVLVVNFWLGGCAPCLSEVPAIDAVYRAHRDQGLAVLSINVGGNPAVVRRLIAETHPAYDLALDQLGLTASRYGVAAFPTTLVIDRGGVIRARIPGELRKDQLAGAVRSLL